MSRILKMPFAVLLLFFPEFVFAASEVAQQSKDVSLLPLKISLVIGLCISLYGVYASRKKKIVLFANLTDIAATAGIPVIAALAIFLAIFLEMKGVLAGIVVSIGVLAVAILVTIATFQYNRSINAGFLGFLLALFTNFFLLTIYVLLLLLIFFSGNKRQGESEAAFRRRSRRERGAAFLGATALFGILAFLGLWDRNFVTFKEYLNGAWGAADPA